jgi:hypothetical protein
MRKYSANGLFYFGAAELAEARLGQSWFRGTARASSGSCGRFRANGVHAIWCACPGS